MQVHVTGNIVARRTNYRNERSVHFAVGHAESLKYCSVRGLFYALFDQITSHDFSFPPGYPGMYLFAGSVQHCRADYTCVITERADNYLGFFCAVL